MRGNATILFQHGGNAVVTKTGTEIGPPNRNRVSIIHITMTIMMIMIMMIVMTNIIITYCITILLILLIFLLS
jgi:hypothetical protein